MKCTKRLVKNVTEYLVYDELDEFEDYTDLLKDLYNATANDEIILRLNSPGGRIDIGMSIVWAIRDSKAKINVILDHPCYSMASIIALSGHSLTFRPNTFLMLHDYSTLAYGKGNEIEKQTNAFKEHITNTYYQVCRPFLTKAECDKILDGVDLYIHSSDMKTKDRLERHFK